MPKNQKTDYLKLLYKIADNALCNAGYYVSIIKKKTNTEPPKQLYGALCGLIYDSLTKDYFTKLEREDILMLSMLLRRLCEKTEMLCELSRSNIISREIITLADCIYGAVSNIKNMIVALEGFPKSFSANDFSKKHYSLNSEFGKLTINCPENKLLYQSAAVMDCCTETVNYTEYAVIKNS